MIYAALRTFAVTLAVLAFAGCAHAQPRPESIVDASAMVPGLIVEMRYFGSNNFVGRPIRGYERPVCLLTREAAAALANAQQALAPFGLGLKVFDCYRPARAIAHFASWARDLNDQAGKPEYYPNVDKTRLFELGYIAERSGHSRGSTVDLTIVNLTTGDALDMGGAFDLFDTRSWPSEPNLEPHQRANRALLQSVMRASGFRPYDQEWWHFTLENEPNRDIYYDFPVR